MRCAQCGRGLDRGARGRPRRYCDRACQARAYRERKNGTPARATGRPVAASRRIDRETAVASAIALADAEGLPTVTMRVLAARLGITPTTLYRHVSSKDALVSHMMSRVLAEYRPPRQPLTTWRQRLRYEARQEWELYRRHPWLLPVLATTRPPLGGELLTAVDRPMSALYALGVESRVALSMYLVVSGFVQGAAHLLISESEQTRHTGLEMGGWWQRQGKVLAGAIGSGRYPWLAALAEDTGGAIDLDEWFDFGLERVFDGIEAQLDKT